MELEGKVIMDLGTVGGVSKAGNNWTKKSIVAETFGQYPRKVKMDLFGENRINSNPLTVGQSYKFLVDAESREFNGRWYTDLSIYSTQPIDQPNGFSAPQQPQQSFQQSSESFQQPAASGPIDPFAGEANETDDLPF